MCLQIRQGGILSPTSFSIYMDDLSTESGIGCHIDDLCINHVFYANDLCLIARCAIALHELIGLCYEYSVETDLNFNTIKSYCVACTPKLYNVALPSLHINYLPISHIICAIQNSWVIRDIIWKVWTDKLYI